MADMFSSKYLKNKARYEKSAKPFIDNSVGVLSNETKLLVQVSFNDDVSKFKNKVSLANKQEIFSQNCRGRYIFIEKLIRWKLIVHQPLLFKFLLKRMCSLVIH